jgi:hypothetical protein
VRIGMIVFFVSKVTLWRSDCEMVSQSRRREMQQ